MLSVVNCGGKMRRTSEERQKQIRQEALRIIHFRGYSNLSIRELAKNVGISEPAIYRHFQNKEAIIFAILDTLSDQFLNMKQELDKIARADERLYQFIIRMVQYLEKNQEMTAVLFNDEIFPPDSAAAAKLQEIILRRQNYLQGLIEAAQAEAQIRQELPAADLVLIIVGLIHKIVSEWRRLGFRFDMISRVRAIILTLKQMIK